MLVDRDGFAGQRRLIGGYIGSLHQPQVGGDHIARLQHDDVAGHHLLGRYDAGMAVAAHAHRMRSKRTQCLDRACGFQLCKKADQRIDREYGGNGRPFFQFTKIKCQCGGGAEQVDHRTLELMKKDDQSTGFARRHDGVGTKLLQAASGFLVGKPFARRHAKACQYPICRQRLWCIRQRFQRFRHTSLAPMRFFVRLGSKIMEIGREKLEPSQRGDPSTANLALLGGREMFALSPQSRPKRTLI